MNNSVASLIREDFTAHPKEHPLIFRDRYHSIEGTPLRNPRAWSPDVNDSVASLIREDFTAHTKTHAWIFEISFDQSRVRCYAVLNRAVQM